MNKIELGLLKKTRAKDTLERNVVKILPEVQKLREDSGDKMGLTKLDWKKE